MSSSTQSIATRLGIHGNGLLGAAGISSGAGAGLLGPVLTLNLWTLFMEGWMLSIRIPAIKKLDIVIRPDTKKDDIVSKLPPHTQWPTDNYNHLHEQPLAFYAVAITLALLGGGGSGPGTTYPKLESSLAWSYVGLRIAHSLVQATVNQVWTRFTLFGASSVVMLGLTARAVSYFF